MDKNRYKQQQARVRIKVPQRHGSGIVAATRRPATPSVIKEYIVKYSAVTPVYASSKTSYFSTPVSKKANKVKQSKPRVDQRSIEKRLARTTNKAILLSRAVEAKKRKKQKTHWLAIKRLAVGTFVILLLVATGYVSLDAWQTNLKTKQVLAAVDTSSKKNNDDSKSSAKFPTGVETKKPSANSLNTYKVASDLPRAIYINNINVSARIMPMGLNADNSVQAPTNAYDSGWYTSSAKPGQSGAMLIDGHASETGTYDGLFGRMINLKNGDVITIERGDGVKFNYSVVKKEITPLAEVDMNKLLVPYDGADQGINLIACTGKWNKERTTLDHRVLVYATLQ